MALQALPRELRNCFPRALCVKLHNGIDYYGTTNVHSFVVLNLAR